MAVGAGPGGSLCQPGCDFSGYPLSRPLSTLQMRAPNSIWRKGWKAGGWGSSRRAGRQRTGARGPRWGRRSQGEVGGAGTEPFPHARPAARARFLQAGLGTVPLGWTKVRGQDNATCSWVTNSDCRAERLAAVSFASYSTVSTEDGEVSWESS